MEVNTKKLDNRYEIEVIGAVKTIDETREIRSVLDDILTAEPAGNIDMYLKETDVITSSLIGILIKLIYGENAKITIYTTSDKLFQLIERLNLVDTLNIKKMEK